MDLVVVGQIVIIWPIYRCKNDTVSEPLCEIINQLVPIGLERHAPVTLLHVKVKHDELARVLVDELVQFLC